MGHNEIKSRVRSFLLKELLPDRDAETLSDDTPLLTAGILDSLDTLTLAVYLELQFGIELADRELDTENLDTIGDISRLVVSKMAPQEPVPAMAARS